jgi:hypothetical protein
MRSNDLQPAGQLGATLEAAMEFGLDGRELCSAVIEVCDPSSFDDETLEQLNAALARRIMAGMRDEAA